MLLPVRNIEGAVAEGAIADVVAYNTGSSRRGETTDPPVTGMLAENVDDFS